MDQVISIIGLNHSTAPVAIREKLTFPEANPGESAATMVALEGVRESIVISTCNRSEVIICAENSETAVTQVIETIAKIHHLKPEEFLEHLYVKDNLEAIRHTFRVASSLDSMVLGEPQILGQVKEAYRRATKTRSTGPILNRLMHKAFFAAKKVRNETGIGMAAVSVAYAAVELAAKILGDLKKRRALLIGAGEMAELAARHLVSQVEAPIVVVNRTYQTAVCLADELNGCALEMDNISHALEEADVIITSTGSCEPIIVKDQMRRIMKTRRYRPIFLIDIAIPRDVSPDVGDIDGVYLYNIDDLHSVVTENEGERRKEAQRAEKIVYQEAEKFVQWMATLDSAPTIIALLEKLETIRTGEISRMNGKLSDLSEEQREAIEAITKGIVNKIAHDPIVFLKKMSCRNTGSLYTDMTQKMFQLIDEDTNSRDLQSDEASKEL